MRRALPPPRARTLRLRLVSFAAVLITAAAAGAAAQAPADAWPTRPVHVVVGYGPGSSMDVVARLFGTKLATALGQPVVVENHAGVSGNVANQLVAKAAPDGYTLGIVGLSAAVLRGVLGPRAVDPARGFAPVIRLTSQPCMVTVTATSPLRSIADLVALARAEPGKLAHGTLGIGSPPHVAAEMFAQRAGIELLNVPYSAPSQLLTDLLSGVVPLTFSPLPFVEPHIRDGRLRGLAVTSARRSPAFPELPTLVEAGYPGVVVTSWFGVVAPTGVAPEIVARLNAELARILEQSDVRARLAALGMEAEGGSAAQFGAFLANEVARLEPVVRAARITVD
jgi:tripartite-type tricarboxylate transporter receptor subunit TctC